MKEEAIFDLLNLEPIKVNIENIYLDPNNPRFAIDISESIPDYRIKEENIQKDRIERLKDIGIDDLEESIKKYGFLTIDRVIVRPIDSQNFVVVEGNRRIAALKRIKEKHKKGEISLDKEIINTLNEIEVLVYRGDKRDIAWTVQGFRHLTGIKNWPPLQQAKFITKNFFEEKNLSFSEIARLLNMKPTQVGVMIRSYYGYRQAKDDDEFGEEITPDKFSMFSEAIFKKPSLKKWLSWSDHNYKFMNEENFKKFLSWIIPNENGDIKIERALDVRDILSKLVLEKYKNLLEKFENGDINIYDAQAELQKEEAKEEVEKKEIDVDIVLGEIERLYRKLSTLPMPQIISSEAYKKKLLDIFIKIKNAINAYEIMLKSAL